MSSIKKLGIVFAMWSLFSCNSVVFTDPGIPVIDEKGTALSSIKGPLAGSDAIVLNSLGETMSAVSKKTPREIVNNFKDDEDNILNTGAASNQILVRGGMAFIINSLANNLQVVDLNLPGIFTEISTGTGTNPYFMTFFDYQGRLRVYITNLLGGTDNNGNVIGFEFGKDGYTQVANIEMPSGVDLEPFGDPSKAGPQGICVSNGKIYVTLTNLAGWFAGGPGWVVVIDPAKGEIIDRIKTTGLNTAVAYASKYVENRVYIVSTGTYTGDGVVDVIDTAKDEIVGSLPIGGAPAIMTITEDLKAYVTDALGPHLLSFNAQTLEILNDDSNPVPVADPAAVPFNFLSFVDVDANGLLWTLAFGSDELYILDPSTNAAVEGPYLMGDGPIGLVLDK